MIYTKLAFIILGWMLLIDYVMATPEVMESYSSGECVAVYNYESVFFSAENYSCENLPTRYSLVYAK